MLILNRKDGESLYIYPQDGVDPEMTVRELFEKGPIVVHVLGRKKGGTSIGVAAPEFMAIFRQEVLARES